MQRLKPLKVPWQVSPSTPYLKLVSHELSGEFPTQVIFVANFGLRLTGVQKTDLSLTRVFQASDPHLHSLKADNDSATSLVRMDFRGGMWARITPAFSDREVLNPRAFDVSLIPYSNPSNDVGVWLQDFQSFWLKSGSCPDPGVYTVESSEWIESLDLTGFEHYVIQGHDAFIEVLAKDWKWDEIQKLPESW